MLFWIFVGLVVMAAAMAVVLLVRRGSAPKFETYRPGEYNSLDEPYKGPGPQQPGGTPIGYHM